MSLVLECAKVDPAIGCQFVAQGETEDELVQKVVVHAKVHGISEVTPELIELVKANIRKV